MKAHLRFLTNRPSFAVLICLLGFWLLGNPTSAHAQCQGAAGGRVVYNSSGQACLGSTAYIDASAFGTTSANTICNIIYKILSSNLTTYPTTGAVIDARGLVDGVSASFTCASNESPWFSGTYQNFPSVLLLPVGTITISYTWVVPDRTKLIGQASGSSTSTLLGTNIVAGSGTFSGPASGYSPVAPVAMIQFGDPGSQTCLSQTGVCFHISLEDVTLNGDGKSIDGILNMDSQELTYAKRVNLLNFAGTGLQIGYSCGPTPPSSCAYYAQAQNSGPYEQIYYSRFRTVRPNLRRRHSRHSWHHLRWLIQPSRRHPARFREQLPGRRNRHWLSGRNPDRFAIHHKSHTKFSLEQRAIERYR